MKQKITPLIQINFKINQLEVKLWRVVQQQTETVRNHTRLDETKRKITGPFNDDKTLVCLSSTFK